MYSLDSFNSREELICAYLSFFQFMPTSQIHFVAFPKTTSIRYCQRLLKNMTDQKKVKRFKSREYVYYLDKLKPDRKSILIINSLYFDIVKKGKVIKYQPEMVFFSGRCDGFFVAEYKGKKKKFFVEVDRGTANFNKVKIYNTLLRTDWRIEWWADPLMRKVISFPLVVVLTNRRHIIEKNFVQAKFNYYIFDLYNPHWEKIFSK